MIYGDYEQDAPQADIVAAVARGEIDVAFVWGPVAGFFGARQPVPMTIMPVSPAFDGPQLPMLYDVSLGVRKADAPLKREVDAILLRRRSDIRILLKDFDVPISD